LTPELSQTDVLHVYEDIIHQLRKKFRRAAATHACFTDVLASFKQDLITVRDPEASVSVPDELPLTDPEFVYRLLAITEACMTTLGQILVLD
jgi:hypothetical protein